jgi:SOS-response transcriptional repressor LexA
MKKLQGKLKIARPDWATSISDLRTKLSQSQTVFGNQLHVSAMAISRWERGAQEPTAEGYIGLGNLSGAPLCWYFWGRAGLRNEDLMRVLPGAAKRMRRENVISYQLASAGPGSKKPKISHLAAIPLLKSVAASHGEKGDSTAVLHDAPVENMIAAPSQWCPNPASTSCLRVRGNSMAPLIQDGYILAVDSSQTDHSKLNGKIVIAWHKDMGLNVSRLNRYGPTEVLQPENKDYQSIVLDNKNKWKILATVLWWIGKSP